MIKPKKCTILLIAILILLSPILYVVLGWTTVFVGMWLFMPPPPKPQETYGEFPFEVIYEINGEIKKVNDVYICEYDGVGMNEGVGKYRKWKGYIKGTGEYAVLITEDKERKIYCDIGDAKYYMNDEDYPTSKPLNPRLYDIPKDRLNGTLLDIDEIPQLYQIELISWQFSDPIENTFE